MREIRLTTLVLILFLALPVSRAFAQNTAGRWALGFHGGTNMWFNDYNKRLLGPGGEVMLRYGIGRNFSAGLLVGYEELKSNQVPLLPGSAITYMKLHAIPASFVGWIHLAPGQRFNPYLYVGAGAMIYKRLLGGNVYVPDSRFLTTIHVPIGAGFEIMASRQASIAVDLGYRVTDDWVDGLKVGKLGGYATLKAGVNIYLGSSDADDDDRDGLSNGEEATLGTNPNNPDTDGDGLRDGEEVRRYKTNPLKADTDGDGLSDGDEVHKYLTDPNKTDTDGDGLSDGDEVHKYLTDPNKADTDGDGLSDGDEALKYHSDPLRVDTDGDGLSDWDEVKVYKTDPAKADTDGDGLSDSEEIKTYHTSPITSDSDGGGVNDGIEVKRGTNPLDPKDDNTTETVFILEKGKTIILKGVNFATNKAILTRESETTLTMAYNAMLASPDVNILIVGHTDNVGTADYNKTLSMRRAKAVKDWLMGKGINARRMSVSGKGFDEPIDSNTTEDGRANNRRMEFRVLE